MRNYTIRYLSQVKGLNEKINTLMQERDDYRLMSTSTGSFDYSAERVQTSNPLEARFTITMEKYFELEQKINIKIDEYVELKRKIWDEIRELKDGNHIKILTHVFIYDKPVEEIMMHKKWRYKRRQTYNIYNQALDDFFDTVLSPRAAENNGFDKV